MRILLAGLILVACCATASAAPIAGTYQTFGATTGTGPWTLTSTNATFSALRLNFTTPVKFSDMTSLSAAYDAQIGGIAAGAPRFSLSVDTNNDNVPDSSFLIHWGPAGSFNDPSLGLGNTGNLLALLDNGRYDLTNIGGSGYTDRTAALALAGNYNVYRATIIIDSFGGNDRRFVIDGISADAVTAAAEVPEPASLAVWSLLAAGGAVMGWRRRRVTGT
jgi:hypothetical protein